MLLLLLFFAATSSIINSMTSDGLGFKGLYKVLGLSGVEGFPGNFDFNGVRSYLSGLKLIFVGVLPKT